MWGDKVEDRYIPMTEIQEVSCSEPWPPHQRSGWACTQCSSKPAPLLKLFVTSLLGDKELCQDLNKPCHKDTFLDEIKKV